MRFVCIGNKYLLYENSISGMYEAGQVIVYISVKEHIKVIK